MIYVGIDPGQTGALVAIHHNSERFTVVDFDENEVRKALVEMMSGNKLVVGIEKVHSMPGQGVSSTFKFGVNYGWWLGTLSVLGVEPHEITPQRWKKHFGLIGSSKDDARAKAIYMHSGLKPLLMRKKDHNRADALLIAQYMKETVKI